MRLTRVRRDTSTPTAPFLCQPPVLVPFPHHPGHHPHGRIQLIQRLTQLLPRLLQRLPQRIRLQRRRIVLRLQRGQQTRDGPRRGRLDPRQHRRGGHLHQVVQRQRLVRNRTQPNLLDDLRHQRLFEYLERSEKRSVSEAEWEMWSESEFSTYMAALPGHDRILGDVPTNRTQHDRVWSPEGDDTRSGTGKSRMQTRSRGFTTRSSG